LIHLESFQGTQPPRPGGFCISKNASITRPPQAGRADCELKSFVDWFEGTKKIDPVLRAGLAYLGFVPIHPFDDGNGRIARDCRHGSRALRE
jgi:Fic family protein